MKSRNGKMLMVVGMVLGAFLFFRCNNCRAANRILFKKYLIAYLSFDGSLKKGVSQFAYDTKLKGKPEFVKGFLGRGLQVGDGDVLNITNLPINTKSGTILIRIKPLWSVDQKGNLWILNIGGFHFMDLYKKGLTGKSGKVILGMQYRFKDAEKKYVISHDIDGKLMPKKNKWYSLAINWDSQVGCSFYINGVLIKSIERQWNPPLKISNIIIGSLGSKKIHGNKVVIDELYIYNKDLPVSNFFQKTH